MAVCWLSARTCRGRAEFIPTRTRSGARFFVLARHRFSFSRHSPLLFHRMAARSQNSLLPIDGRPCGRRPATRLPCPRWVMWRLSLNCHCKFARVNRFRICPMRTRNLASPGSKPIALRISVSFLPCLISRTMGE